MNPRWWGLALAVVVHALVLGWKVSRPDQPRTPTAVAVSLAPRSAPSPGASSPSPAPVEPSRVPSPHPQVEPSPNASDASPGSPESSPSHVPEPAEAEASRSGGDQANVADPEGPPTEAPFDFEAWATLVRQGVDTHKSYPYAARTRGLEGRVTVALSVAPEGNLAAVPRVSRSSGHAILDRAALAAVTAAVPFPGIPLGAPRELELTLVFTLR